MPRATVNVNLEAHRNNPEPDSGSIPFEPFIAGNTLKARLAIIWGAPRGGRALFRLHAGDDRGAGVHCRGAL